jgi:glutathione S-transferase
MPTLSLHDPLFATYAVAAALMILKGVAMSWLTVVRMIQEKGGYRSPEDLRRTTINPDPRPEQLAPNDRVERIRRIQQNDLENLPYFLVAGLLFVLAGPPPWVARALLYGYVVSRLLHFYAYLSARDHETRAASWTVGSLILVAMTFWALASALPGAFA